MKPRPALGENRMQGEMDMQSEFTRRNCILCLRQLKKRAPGRKIESPSILSFYPVIMAVLLSWLIIPVNVPDPAMAKSANTGTGGHRVVRVVLDDHYPPYVFRNQNGKLEGMLIDEWRLWEKKTGVMVQITACDWSRALEEMKAGKYDVIDTVFYTKERSAWLDFTKPYAKIDGAIFYHQDVSGITDVQSLQGFLVAVKAGDANTSLLRSQGVTNLWEFPSYEAIISAAKAGKVKVFVMDEPPALYFLIKNGLGGEFKASQPIYTGEFHRAVLKGNAELLSLVERGFNLITPAEHWRIEKKWLGESVILAVVSRHLRPFLLGAIAIAAGFFFLWLWGYFLQRQVSRRTLPLANERKLLEVTLLSIGDGVVVTDKKGKIKIINKTACEMAGVTEKEAVGEKFDAVLRLVNEQTGLMVESPVEKVLQTENAVSLANHTALLARDGTRIPIADSASPIKDEKGRVLGAVVIFRDISSERAWQQNLLYLSTHDTLTGLYNRWFMEEKINQMDRESEVPVGVITADVDALKLVNDSFGNQVGDRILKQAAEILMRSCQNRGIIGRWGGNEFLMLLPGIHEDELEDIAEEITRMCSETDPPGPGIGTSLSLGYAVKKEPAESLVDKVNIAERLMYRRKLVNRKSHRSQIITALLSTLAAKSGEAGDHAERLIFYSLEIAKKLGLSEKEMDELVLLAELHDIGKIGIRETILQKPGPLSPEEWEEMRKHPEIGCHIVSNIPELSGIAEYILYHQERWDGKGYPFGLRGEEIPILCRILAIADAYDAMTTDRVYRQAMTTEEAIAEIRNNINTQFDPVVAAVFLHLMERGQLKK